MVLEVRIVVFSERRVATGKEGAPEQLVMLFLDLNARYIGTWKSVMFIRLHILLSLGHFPPHYSSKTVVL